MGAAPALAIEKLIADDEADAAPGVRLAAGVPATVEAVVSNVGDVPVTDIRVADDVIPGGLDCPTDELAAGASMTCTATLSGLAPFAQHANTATVTGIGPTLADGTRVGPAPVSDGAHAFADGAATLALEKRFNGEDADDQPGILVGAASRVGVTYTVTNTGHAPLTGVTVTDADPAAGPITCPTAELAPGASMDCVGSRTAPSPGSGTFGGIATATADEVRLADGTPAGPSPASDPAWGHVPDTAAETPGETVVPPSSPTPVIRNPDGSLPQTGVQGDQMPAVLGLGLLLTGGALLLIRRRRARASAERG